MTAIIHGSNHGSDPFAENQEYLPHAGNETWRKLVWSQEPPTPRLQPMDLPCTVSEVETPSEDATVTLGNANGCQLTRIQRLEIVMSSPQAWRDSHNQHPILTPKPPHLASVH